MSIYKVRYAPSPTGPLHIGGARTVLFDYLLAKQNNGIFLIRSEDTDLARSSAHWEDAILDSIEWLGLSWQEGLRVGGENGPYRQTERLHIYQQYLDKLFSEGHCYKCFCTEEEIEKERQIAYAKGETPKYSGKCRNLTPEQISELEQQGRKFVIRFKVPQGKIITVDDKVRGLVQFESDGIGDFVIVKSDGIPTYNFAVVIDDITMGITHVIRGDEHLSNTPRQILIYEALNAPLPVFGHVSIILNEQKKKMSKRDGDTSIDQYREKGYLPEAMINFLALLGWAPEGEKEFFTLDELVKEFSLERVSKNPAVFNLEKLRWMNSVYIKKMDIKDLTNRVKPFLKEHIPNIDEYDSSWLEFVVETYREKMTVLSDIVPLTADIFHDDIDFEDEKCREILQEDTVESVINLFKEKIIQAEELNYSKVEEILKSLTKELGLGGKKVFMPLRVALTGKTHGSELYSLIPILGKERVIKRVDYMMAKR
ncbi:nondiscriminating glutamyl-tRNA synthetase [Anaerobranca gottschalkii DSM 13577]|uniref:Glutamate--tRNA ligase n=1 Tax=Anaerobranca gottschalkii DSM 13577 TaxID=1120990 RepID=A0A1I0B4Z0_9FIRM|nr:nondiscriminating glutamyl-tRNA synthetase [Anaerobranca gottschalkii DSM 13577]